MGCTRDLETNSIVVAIDKIPKLLAFWQFIYRSCSEQYAEWNKLVSRITWLFLLNRLSLPVFSAV